MEILTDATLKALLDDTREKIALCFTGDHCPHCHTYAPIFRTVSETRHDWRCYLVDTAAAPAACEIFGVRSIPTTILLQGREELARHTGVLSPGALAKFLSLHA